MAGLLDIFGSGGGQTLGLLGMSPEDIQRSRDDAQAQALYGLAARLFQGGNTGQSIAEGLQQGQKMYRSAMDTQLQEQLQGFQMKDLLEKRKREQEALARQALIDRAVVGSYQPARQAQELYGEDMMGQQVGEGVIPARAAGLDLQSLAPALMASPEGRKTLADLVASQKALRPETFSLAEGAQQFERDPFTGQVRQVASGIAKPVPVQRLTGAEGNAALRLFQTNDPIELAKIPGAMDKIAAEATKARKDTAMVLYPPGALVPDKGTVKDLQSSLVESGSRLSMYNQIESQFKPEYLQPKFKAGQAWSAIKEKAGTNLAPEEKQSLAEFSQFKQNTLNNLSQTIKALTGASMGVQEAARIEAGLPSAGQGIFDGDSPTEFQAKLNNTMRELRLVEARTNYILRKGLSFKDVPLENVPKLINDRASELAKQYQVDLKKATPTQMNAIKRQLSVEFGISAD
jgi:hypothetical protein